MVAVLFVMVYGAPALDEDFLEEGDKGVDVLDCAHGAEAGTDDAAKEVTG